MQPIKTTFLIIEKHKEAAEKYFDNKDQDFQSRYVEKNNVCDYWINIMALFFFTMFFWDVVF